jgi:uncharacterized protein (TIGR03067 family)
VIFQRLVQTLTPTPTFGGLMLRKLHVALAIGVAMIGTLVSWAGLPLVNAGEKEKDKVIAVLELTKDYAENAGDFDKKYQGMVVTIEGVVGTTGVKVAGKTFLMMDGYTKPGDKYAHLVRCEESGPDFEGIRKGHKVRIKGTVQGHSETSVAAELLDCKVVKVFADDYPPSKSARAEVKKLQGMWKVVGGEAEGKQLGPKQAGFDAVSFEGYTVYLHQGNQLLPFGLALDPDKAPKTLDLLGGKATLPCIYASDGGKLRLVLPASAKGGFTRPEGFDTTKTQCLLLNAEQQKK